MDQALARMAATLADADVDLVTMLGGRREVSRLRAWRGQVLVEWEPDERAGGCLLRPELVRRLLALHANITSSATEVALRASGRVVSALSAEHRELVAGLGGERAVELRLRLRFDGDEYRGGEERYSVVQAGRRLDVVTLRAEVKPRVARPASPRTSPAPT